MGKDQQAEWYKAGCSHGMAWRVTGSQGPSCSLSHLYGRSDHASSGPHLLSRYLYTPSSSWGSESSGTRKKAHTCRFSHSSLLAQSHLLGDAGPAKGTRSSHGSCLSGRHFCASGRSTDPHSYFRIRFPQVQGPMEGKDGVETPIAPQREEAQGLRSRRHHGVEAEP